jgi:hypothetical protein
MRQLQRRLGEVAFAFHAAPVTLPTNLLTYLPTNRCFGAPARRVFPDHLITNQPTLNA